MCSRAVSDAGSGALDDVHEAADGHGRRWQAVASDVGHQVAVPHARPLRHAAVHHLTVVTGG